MEIAINVNLFGRLLLILLISMRFDNLSTLLAILLLLILKVLVKVLGCVVEEVYLFLLFWRVVEHSSWELLSVLKASLLVKLL